MSKTILVPLDGFEHAEHALTHAIAMATRWRAMIRLVHVLDHAVPPPYALGMTSYDWRNGAAALAADTYIRSQQARVTAAGVSVTYSLLEGSIAESILSYAEDCHVDLIVMATHGRGPITRILLGSVADRIANHSNTPVLFIRAADHAMTQVPARFDAILVPLDGSPIAESALDPALEIARLDGGHLILFHVSFPTNVVLPVMQADLTSGLSPVFIEPLYEDTTPADYLTLVAEAESDAGVAIMAEVCTSIEAPEYEISRFAREHDVDLIVLGTRAHTTLSSLLGMSVTDHAIRQATIPIMVLRPELQGGREDR